jgi:hypothetical protein
MTLFEQNPLLLIPIIVGVVEGWNAVKHLISRGIELIEESRRLA